MSNSLKNTKPTRIGECLTIMTKLADNEPKKEIDLRQVGADDLKSIQKQDPFMYYSIPGVRSATVLLRDIDTSNLGASLMSRNCVSCPSRLRTQDNAPSSQKVARRTCISFECYPDLIFEDLLDDGEDLDMGDADGALGFLDFLMAASSDQK
ncbi:hypothetical protein ACHAXR_010158 [Thalassiosira sp. AJA248-18]